MSCTYVTQVLLLVVFLGTSVQDESIHYKMDDAPALFDTFIKRYNRTYKDDEDKNIHFGYFKNNLDIINQLNERSHPDTTFIINRFADFSENEIDKWLDDHQ